MNHSSLRVAAIAVLTVLITIAWASYGGQVLDGRQPYRAIPIEPGGLHPIPTSTPRAVTATDAPRATRTPEVAPTPSPTPEPPASPGAQAQAQRNEGPVTAALAPARSPAPTPRPTATPRPPLTAPASHATPMPKPVTRRPVTSPKPVTNTTPGHITTAWRRVASSAYGIGDGFLGGHMACGGRVDLTSLTVAYRYLHTSRAELHCGDHVLIRLAGSKGPGIRMTVTDAGPFVGARIFDLAPGACRALGVCGIPSIEWRKVG